MVLSFITNLMLERNRYLRVLLQGNRGESSYEAAVCPTGEATSAAGRAGQRTVATGRNPPGLGYSRRSIICAMGVLMIGTV